MAWVTRFKHDVFISYARVDDASADDDPNRGWVAQFCKHLDVALSKKVGRLDTIKIWRDTRRIQGNQLFDQTIEDAIADSAIFVALTSRGYLESEYCRQELQWFHDKVQRDGIGLTVGDEYRICNVRLTGVPREEWPQQYGRTTGWPMYEEAEGEDEGEPSTPGSENFGRHLREVAQAIYETLRHLRSLEPVAETTKPAAQGRMSVFLADTSDTLRSLKKRVITELASVPDIEVITNVPPPFEAAEHDERVRAIVAGAGLSVHLIDAWPGRDIPGTENGYFPKRQIEIAKEHGEQQLIWAPKELDTATIEDTGHRAFLEQLENGSPDERNSEFQRGLASAVPRQIVDKIQELRARAVSAPASNARAAALLDTHFKDQLFALELSQYLVRHNIQPYINPQEDDPRRNLEIFAQRLKQAAYLILFCGAVADEWLRARFAVALQIAISENCPLQACGVYLAPPRTADTPSKIRLPVIAVEWMDHTRGFNPEAVDHFFQKASASGAFLGSA